MYKLKYHLAAVLFFTSAGLHAQPADSVLNFMTANKSRTAIYLMRNEEVLAQLNENKMMPLAGNIHLLIAVEFAKQASEQLIFDQDKVPLTDLDKYYIPETDNGVHEDWLAYAQAKHLIKDDSIRLIDVARGMMMFDNNACAEYLIDLMGMDNVRSNIRIFNIEKHSEISPMIASMFLYQNPKKKKEDAILKDINKMSDEMYASYSMQIHKALENEPGFKSKFRLRDYSPKMQKLYSDRLTASTAKEYAQIVAALNRRMIFDDAIYAFVAEIMETCMENPDYVTWLRHAGIKTGTTPFVITKTIYGTTKNKTRVEMAYFFNDLSEEEHKKLLKWSKEFDEQVLESKDFRGKIAAAFSE